MCLSTVYRNTESEENIIAKYVAEVNVGEDKISLKDVMGFDTEIVGKILHVDLTGGKIIVSEN